MGERESFAKVFIDNVCKTSGLYKQRVQNKVLSLDPLAQQKRKKSKRKLVSVDRIPAGTRLKMADFQKMNKLWEEYIDKVIKNPKEACERLLKADLHGAFMRVHKSKIPSMVGHEGYVAQEKMHSFVLVTKDDIVKIIPKQGCVFELIWKGKPFLLYGNAFCVRSGERTTRKWKEKPSIDL